MNGPQALQHFTQKWQEAYYKRIKSFGYAYAGGIPANEVRTLSGESTAFATEMNDAMLALLTAASLQVPEAEIPELYPKYLQAIAELMVLLDSPSSMETYEKSLEPMLKKNVAFMEKVTNYRFATSGLLRWKARMAEVAGKSVVKSDTVVKEDLFLKEVLKKANAAAPGFLTGRGELSSDSIS